MRSHAGLAKITSPRARAYRPCGPKYHGRLHAGVAWHAGACISG